MKIILMEEGHPLWEKTAAYAQNCSWKAGRVLAKCMLEKGFLPWERVIAAVDSESVAGFCTLTRQDELPEQYGFSPFIGFVFVDERYRGNRLSGQMIRHALRYAEKIGFHAVYIMSGEHGLYEKYGFEKLGDFETIHGTTDQLFRISL